MYGADALSCYCVGVGTILQQRGPNLHLVLFGSDVQRRVAILRPSGEIEGFGMKTELFQVFPRR